jgi:hypothetical protein
VPHLYRDMLFVADEKQVTRLNLDGVINEPCYRSFW